MKPYRNIWNRWVLWFQLYIHHLTWHSGVYLSAGTMTQINGEMNLSILDVNICSIVGITYTIEPTHEKMELMIFRVVVLQMHMRSPLLGYTYAAFAWSFLRVSATCLRRAKPLARLRLCAGSPEPLQVAHVMSTLFSYAGSIREKQKARSLNEEIDLSYWYWQNLQTADQSEHSQTGNGPFGWQWQPIRRYPNQYGDFRL